MNYGSNLLHNFSSCLLILFPVMLLVSGALAIVDPIIGGMVAIVVGLLSIFQIPALLIQLFFVWQKLPDKFAAAIVLLVLYLLIGPYLEDGAKIFNLTSLENLFELASGFLSILFANVTLAALLGYRMFIKVNAPPEA